MSKANPQFSHPGRAAYELPKLLKNLGDLDRTAKLSEEQYNTVDAIVSHAWGAVETIASGLESIGALMGIAGNGDEAVPGKHVAALGDLITHLAVELQHLHEIETDMASTLQSSGNRQVARRPN